jgi:hypothetical protein
MTSKFPGSLKHFEGTKQAADAEQQDRELFYITDEEALRYQDEGGLYHYFYEGEPVIPSGISSIVVGDWGTGDGTPSNPLEHKTSSGYKHIPISGNISDILSNNGDGSAEWINPTSQSWASKWKIGNSGIYTDYNSIGIGVQPSASGQLAIQNIGIPTELCINQISNNASHGYINNIYRARGVSLSGLAATEIGDTLITNNAYSTYQETVESFDFTNVVFALLPKLESQFRTTDANTGFATLYNGPAATGIITATMTNMAAGYGYDYTSLGNSTYITDESNDRILISDRGFISSKTTFTISAWISVPTLTPPGARYIFGAYHDGTRSILCYLFNNSITVVVRNGGSSSVATTSLSAAGITINTPFMVTSVYDGSEVTNRIKVYINNTLLGQGTADTSTPDFVTLGKDFYLGYVSGAAPKYYDSFIVFNSILSDSEISDLYDVGSNIGGNLTSTDNSNGTMSITPPTVGDVSYKPAYNLNVVQTSSGGTNSIPTKLEISLGKSGGSLTKELIVHPDRIELLEDGAPSAITNNYHGIYAISTDSSLRSKSDVGTESLLNAWYVGANNRTLGLGIVPLASGTTNTNYIQTYLDEASLTFSHISGLVRGEYTNLFINSNLNYVTRYTGPSAAYIVNSGIYTWYSQLSQNSGTVVNLIKRMELNASGELLLYSNGTTYNATPVLSGFTATYTGFTTTPTSYIKYSILDNVVTLKIPGFSATSNDNTMTFSGLPNTLWPSYGEAFSSYTGVNNGVDFHDHVSIISGVLTFEYTNNQAGFTPTGSKGVKYQVIQYHL